MTNFFQVIKQPLFSLLIFVLVSGNTQTSAQKKLTLKEAVTTVLQKNVSVLKAATGVDASQSNLQATYGKLLPSVNADAGWNWNSSKSKTSTPVGDVTVEGQARSFSAGVNAGVTLYDGLANYANYDNAKLAVESAQLRVQQIKQDVVFQIITFYYDILSAKEQMKVKEEDLTWNRKNLEIIQERNKLGAITLADVYSQQVRVGNAELELIRAKNTYEKGVTELVYLLGLDVLEQYEIDETSAFEGVKNYSNEEVRDLVQKALEKRADVQIAKLSLRSAGYDLQSANAGYLPTLRGTTGLNFRNNSMSNFFDNRTFSVGLSLDIPIFTGWALDNRVELAKIEQRNREIELSDKEKDIKRTIRKNLLDFSAATKLVEVTKSNVVAAEENRRIEQEKYSLGSTTLLNVLIAQSELTNAKTNLISSQYEDKKLREQLLYLLGLTEISY